MEKSIVKSNVELYSTEGRPALAPSIKEGLLSMQVRQIITTNSSYPGQLMNNNFTRISFGQTPGKPDQEFSSTQTRVTWVEVGGSTTEQEAKEYLDSVAGDAVIYQILSNQPILTDGQKSAIEAGLTTLEKIAGRQLLRVKDVNGDLLIQKDRDGKFQYRMNHFSETPQEDLDLRGNEEYSNAEIQAEYDRQIGIPAPQKVNTKSIVTDLVAA